MDIVLFSAAALFLLAASHPFITYPLSLMALRKFRRRPLSMKQGNAPDSMPTYSICLCAYNEAKILERTIANLLKLRESASGACEVQILLYVDGATDGTSEIALRYADSIDVVISSERRGKSYGLNQLAKRVHGEIVVMMDANTEIAPDALVNIGQYFTDPSIGCVCGNLVFANPDETVTAKTGSLYWRLEEKIKQLESDVGSAMGADGSLYAIRRQDLRALPLGVADDMYLSLAILCDGHRIIRAHDVRAYERSASSAGEEFQRKIRIGCQAYSAHKLLWPHLRRLNSLIVYQYISHKFLRWFTAPILLSAVFLGLAAIASAWGAVWAMATVIAWLILVWGGTAIGSRIVNTVADILLAFLATAIGVYQSINGTIVGTWEPAGSVRSTHGNLVNEPKS